MKTARIISLFLFSISLISRINATNITVGTGVLLNTSTTYPAPYGNWYWGAKHQFLIQASELTAAGMSAGNINSLSFNVGQPYGTPLQGFTIGIKSTLTTTLTVFETGLTTVLSPVTYTEVAGINTHVFSSPFYWDGTSNLLIETCFNNNSYTQNATTYYSNTSFASSIYHQQDAPNVCSSPVITATVNGRPNMIFDWVATATPPTANFSSNSTFTCSGIVDFTDLSVNNPTSWLWDFGDGDTSTAQNPSHTYLTSNTFTVTLIACNAYGCDTLTFNNYITVNMSAATPIAASCYPNTLTYCCDFGITNVSFNTINNTSGDGVEGYSDFTCSQTTVLQGQTYILSIQTAAASTQNYAAWIDFNNDGVFNNTTEKVFTATSQMNISGNVIIPTGTVLNTPLRLRVSAEYDFSAPPTPCGNLDYGQAEDYAVIITTNPNPPTPVFTASPTITCDGIVCFTDQSLNVPTAWLWNFGDGNTSFQQNPCHTYTTDGVYTVTLTVTNANGGNVDSIVNYITVNSAGQVLAASCSPATTSYCCGYGIYQVDLNTISNPTMDGIEGYQDFSCTNSTSVTEGTNYTLTVKTGLNNPQDTRVWIDFNNDGSFNNTNELIMDSPNAYNPTLSVLIPTGAVLNTALRMRVSSDVVGTTQNACSTNDFGQTEDYGVIILPNTSPPISNLIASLTFTCSDTIQFTDLSTNAPTSWLWYFGDGITSSAPNPTHYYPTPGVYTVSLVVTNAFGQDSTAFTNYITVNCTNFIMPANSTLTVTTCSGSLFDDGGLSANYSDNTDGIVVIQPTGATQITLNFMAFDFENNWDFLTVYDGSSVFDPVIGTYTGATIPASISSTGGSITIRQQSDFSITMSGFALNWSCSYSTNNMPITGTDTYTNCNGTLYDNGGPSVNYSNNTDGVVVIQPSGASQITLNFSSFDFENNLDFLTVYDGPSTLSPIIGTYTGSTIPTSISSTGGSITIRQQSNMSTTGTGFELTWVCASTNNNMPTSGTTTFTSCSGTLFDDGGPIANYSNNTDGVVVIQPSGASMVSLNFVLFNFVQSSSGDTLFIYDGPTISSPLITSLFGNATPGVINSTGGSITLRQKSNNMNSDPGFELNWSCTVGVDEIYTANSDFIIYPNPTSDFINVKSMNATSINEIFLFNAVGQLIFQNSTINANQLPINVAELPKGLYFMTIKYNEGTITKKINIQ